MDGHYAAGGSTSYVATKVSRFDHSEKVAWNNPNLKLNAC